MDKTVLTSAARDFVRERVCFYSTAVAGRSSFREIIEDAVRFGAAGVELMSFCPELSEPDLKAARELGALARAGGLSMPCFSLGIDILSLGATAALQRAKGYADICSALEIPYLHHTVILETSDPATLSKRDELFPFGVEFALELNSYAASVGVKTVMEDQGLVFNGVEGFGKLMRATDGKIGVLLDVGNVMFVNERADSFYSAFSDKTVHAHLKDYKILDKPAPLAYSTVWGGYLEYRDLGDGDAELSAVAALLKERGYRGALSLELERPGDEQALLKTLMKAYQIFA